MPISIATAPTADSRTRCASPNTKTPMAIRLDVRRQRHRVRLRLENRRQRGEEAERDELLPVARHRAEVTRRGAQRERGHDETRREVAAEGPHRRVRGEARLLERDDAGRVEERGQQRVALAGIGHQHDERRPRRHAGAPDVEQVDAQRAQQHARHSQRVRSLADRDPGHAEQDQQAHLPQRRHQRDVRELQRLGQGQRRERLRDAEGQAPAVEVRLDRGKADDDARDKCPRQQEREPAPDVDVLVQHVAEALHRGVA